MFQIMFNSVNTSQSRPIYNDDNNNLQHLYSAETIYDTIQRFTLKLLPVMVHKKPIDGGGLSSVKRTFKAEFSEKNFWSKYFDQNSVISTQNASQLEKV